MSKVILVRMELANDRDYVAATVADAMRAWIETWTVDLDAWSVEVVNEDPA